MDKPGTQFVHLAEPVSAMTVDGRKMDLAAGIEVLWRSKPHKYVEGVMWVLEDRDGTKYCGSGKMPRTEPIAEHKPL